MNTRVATGFRPHTRPMPQSWDNGSWLGAVALALGITVLATTLLPGVLVAPAIALALFAASPLALLMAWRAPDARRENARLFAGMLFALGVLAALFADPVRLAAWLG